jgi:hypothetical protein
MKKIFIMLALVAVAAAASAQVSMKSVYNSASDTIKVTNGETGVLQIRNGGAANSTSIVVVVTKTSGTVAGTITLQVSLDGTTWKAMNTPSTATALATFTATDVATNSFHWWFLGNPFPYYRVSWTGTGTMVATASAKILSR